MEPQKSIVIPILFSVLVTALITGVGGYYLGTNQVPTPTPKVTATTVLKSPNPSLSFTPSPRIAPSPVASPADPNSTRTWTSKYGISLVYPGDLSIFEEKDLHADNIGQTEFAWMETNNQDGPFGHGRGVLVRFSYIDTGKKASDEIRAYKLNAQEYSDSVTQSETAVGGLKAYKLLIVSKPAGDAGNKTEKFFIDYQNKVYLIEVGTDYATGDQLFAKVQPVLDSIKFTN